MIIDVPDGVAAGVELAKQAHLHWHVDWTSYHPEGGDCLSVTIYGPNKSVGTINAELSVPLVKLGFVHSHVGDDPFDVFKWERSTYVQVTPLEPGDILF